MKKPKIVTVLGARPQFIKASVVSHAIKESKAIEEVVVHTGQHFDANMSKVFFDELCMAPPTYNLNIHGGRHGAMTGRMLAEIERVLLSERPDVVMVYGDTNSTLAGALAAIKLHIPVAHVEAGLRSFNLKMPEEVNRILSDRISRWLFAPTEAAAEQLRREDMAPDQIIQVGDVMQDAALHHGARIDAVGRVMGRLGLSPSGFVLATIHRAENTDNRQRLEAIIDGLAMLARDLPVVWPLHPRTRGVLQRLGRLESLAKAVSLIDPIGYLDMLQLEKHAAVIATDSGGVQKEAFFYRVPCVTLREETEWVELVQFGWNRLIPPVSAREISEAVKSARDSCGDEVQPYGSGDAALRIVERLREDLVA